MELQHTFARTYSMGGKVIQTLLRRTANVFKAAFFKSVLSSSSILLTTIRRCHKYPSIVDNQEALQG